MRLFRPPHWEARLSDGSRWHEQTPQLQDHGSVWRRLEHVAALRGASIVWARQRVGWRIFGLKALGFPLECGQAFFAEMRMDGSGQTQRLYRFVCRLETRRRVWAIIDPASGRRWLMEGPPDQAQCPDPLAQ